MNVGEYGHVNIFFFGGGGGTKTICSFFIGTHMLRQQTLKKHVKQIHGGNLLS